MRFARKVGPIAIAALVLTAMLGTASASAAETVLCKSSKTAPYCESADRYPAGTSFSAGPGSITAVESSVVNVSCSESTIAGTTGAATGAPLPVSISTWTLGGCKSASGTKCTVTPVAAAPYSGTLNRTSGNNGALNIKSGGSGNPGWTIKCGFLVDCTFTMEPGFAYTGEGSSAEMTASKVPLAKTGKLCPATSTFTATYVVNSPQPARLAIPENAPEPATALCKSIDNFYCEPADLYPSGTEIEGETLEPVINNPSSYPYGDLTCVSSRIIAKTTAAYAEPLPLTYLLTFNGCQLDYNELHCDLTEGSEGSGSIADEVSLGSGSWEEFGAGTSFTVECLGVMTCKYQPSSFDNATLRAGVPGEVDLMENKMAATVTGTNCPKEATLEPGDYKLESPSGFVMVSDAVR